MKLNRFITTKTHDSVELALQLIDENRILDNRFEAFTAQGYSITHNVVIGSGGIKRLFEYNGFIYMQISYGKYLQNYATIAKICKVTDLELKHLNNEI